MQQVDKNEADKSLQQRLHQQQKILIEIKKEFMPISQLLSRTNSNDFASSINTKIIRKILQQANSSNISIVANFNMSNFKLKENKLEQNGKQSDLVLNSSVSSSSAVAKNVNVLDESISFLIEFAAGAVGGAVSRTA